MKMVIERTLLNNDAIVNFSITDISNVDIELLNDFGKPVIQVGGTIPLDVGDFKLSNETRVLPDDFTFTKIFKHGMYNTDTIKYALSYIEEIKKRVTTAITELESKQDTFSGTEEVQL